MSNLNRRSLQRHANIQMFPCTFSGQFRPAALLFQVAIRLVRRMKKEKRRKRMDWLHWRAVGRRRRRRLAREMKAKLSPTDGASLPLPLHPDILLYNAGCGCCCTYFYLQPVANTCQVKKRKWWFGQGRIEHSASTSRVLSHGTTTRHMVLGYDMYDTLSY